MISISVRPLTIAMIAVSFMVTLVIPPSDVISSALSMALTVTTPLFSFTAILIWPISISMVSLAVVSIFFGHWLRFRLPRIWLVRNCISLLLFGFDYLDNGGLLSLLEHIRHRKCLLLIPHNQVSIRLLLWFENALINSNSCLNRHHLLLFRLILLSSKFVFFLSLKSFFLHLCFGLLFSLLRCFEFFHALSDFLSQLLAVFIIVTG